MSKFITLKSRWESGIVNITGEVQQNIFSIIKQARKNYFSIYTQKRDPITNRKKLFFPLTKSIVESVVKNIDLDTRDIQVRGKSSDGIGPAIIVRHIIRNWMHEADFGRFLNKLIRFSAIDGTVIVKVIKEKTDSGNKPVVMIPDILNILFDPSDENITHGLLERHIKPIDEFKRLAKEKKWKGFEDVKGTKTNFVFNENIAGLSQMESDTPYVTLWEFFGKLEQNVIDKFNGKEVAPEKINNPDIVNGHIIFVIQDKGGKTTENILFAEKTDRFPYKIFRYRDVHGRAHGEGVGEILLDLQTYLNETLNIRANTNRLKHMGLFKMRKGQGITPEILSSMITGGIIPVNRQDDIVELRQSDQLQSSYTDEQVIFNWAQRATGSFEISTGEAPNASQPATSSLIADRGASAGFALSREELGMFLNKLFEDLIWPILNESLNEGEIVRITGDQNDLRVLDKAVVDAMVAKEQEKFFKVSGRFAREEEVAEFTNKIKIRFEKLGPQRYFKIVKESFNTQFNIEFFVTNEAFNKNVDIRNLLDLTQILTNFESPLNIQSISKKIIDLMGFDGAKILAEAPLDEPLNKLPGKRIEAETDVEQLIQSTINA